MTVGIAGAGWVTPLGAGVEHVYNRLLAGEQAEAKALTSPVSDRMFPVMRVPDEVMQGLPRHPRLRRASAISRFAVGAAQGAFEDAAVPLKSDGGAQTALVLAVSNGGVIYTKRFFEEIVTSGAQTASPLLFPETVFNAPASHLAAILGITGATYTLVGDGAVGLLALKMAEDLMQQTEIERCLVVAAEEADWLLCDAFRRWRLLRSRSPAEIYSHTPTGMVLSEGAGAVLLIRGGDVQVERVHPGGNFGRRAEAAGLLSRILADLAPGKADFVVASANGTFVDDAERRALVNRQIDTIYAPKAALGESVGASTIWQIIAARQALKSGHLPGTPGVASDARLPVTRSATPLRPGARALVLGCGMNQQAAGAVLSLGS